MNLWYDKYVGVSNIRKGLTCLSFCVDIVNDVYGLNIQLLSWRDYKECLDKNFVECEARRGAVMCAYLNNIPKHVAFCLDGQFILESPSDDLPSHIRSIVDYSGYILKFYRPMNYGNEIY